MLGWLTGRAWHATYAGVSCPFGPRPIGYNEANAVAGQGRYSGND